jgi:AcrR family transcriptional regulator
MLSGVSRYTRNRSSDICGGNGLATRPREKGKPPPTRRDRRHVRHDATRREILDAAWEMVRTDGLGALSLRALARAVGMEPQSLYTYFASKHDVYDAMFADGNRTLLALITQQEWPEDLRSLLRESARLFVEFSAEDIQRHQLLFQRTIPGFEPSPEAYAIAVEVIETMQSTFAAAGLTKPSQFDLWTAIVAGLAAQQNANDPGGDRWLRLVDEAADMYANHVLGRAGGED